ncbi:hypothetical protein BDR07DRAFT_1297909 [Suillus spraguei]|nr:hypothetical protein BDR07DRAFT_1297909 [Suillus spraguei]
MLSLSPRPPPTQWNDGETAALVNYLYDHRSEAEGAGNFKQQVLSSAAEYINNHETLQSTWAGPLKTAKSTQNKWTSLKNTFHAIEKYRNQTGVHWDNETGAGIEGPAAVTVWTSYIKVFPLVFILI